MGRDGLPEREARILDAAADLIAHYGYDKTTIDDIARGAHISKGAVYLHFRSKEELVETLLLRETDRMIDDMMARLDADPRGVTIFNLYRYAMIALLDRPLLKAMYTDDVRTFGDFIRRLRRLPIYQRSGTFGVEFVRHFQEAGLLRKDLPPEALSYLLITVRTGLLHVGEYLDKEHIPPLDQIGEYLGEMLERAFSPPDITEVDRERGRAALMGLLQMGREVIRQQQEDRAKKKGEKPL